MDHSFVSACPDSFTTGSEAFAFYCAFDIKFAPGLQSFFQFLDNCVLGILKTKTSAAIQRRINVFHA